jgi:uncharacterized protein (AIM24 family)
MSHLGTVKVGCSFDSNPATLCCSGLGCCRQKISGTDSSIAFLSAGGTIIFRYLKAGERIVVDTRSVVGFEDSVELGITPNGRCCTCLFGGEGCFSTTLTGPGKVFLQVSTSILRIRSTSALFANAFLVLEHVLQKVSRICANYCC